MGCPLNGCFLCLPYLLDTCILSLSLPSMPSPLSMSPLPLNTLITTSMSPLLITAVTPLVVTPLHRKLKKNLRENLGLNRSSMTRPIGTVPQITQLGNMQPLRTLRTNKPLPPLPLLSSKYPMKLIHPREQLNSPTTPFLTHSHSPQPPC